MVRARTDRVRSAAGGPSPSSVAFVLGTILVLTGCGSDPAGPSGPELTIRVEGRIERSLTARATLLSDGSEVPRGDVTWSVEPASAAEISSSGELTFATAGTLTLRGRTAGAEATRSLDVARPPRIVFDMRPEQGAARDIYAVDLDGRKLERLTTDPATDVTPASDGSRVIFASFRDGDGELYRVDPAGGEATRLTTTDGNEGQPDLSDDGTRLAFTRRSGGGTRIWVGAADATGAELLTEGTGLEGGIEGDPSWAPGSGSVAFMSTAAGAADLYRWSPDGVTTLVDAPGADLEPEWDPSGDGLVFTSGRGEGGSALFLLDLASGEETRIDAISGSAGHPAWIGPGRVVFTLFGEDGSELRWLDLDAGGPPRPIPLPGQAPEHPVLLRTYE